MWAEITAGLRKLKKELGDFGLKQIILIGSIFGVLYLFSFTTLEKIPFPIEIKVLPSLIVAVGFLAALFAIVILFAMLMPSLALTDPFEADYPNIFVDKSEPHLLPIRMRIFNYIASSGLPFFAVCASAVRYLIIQEWDVINSGLVFASFAWVIAYCYKSNPKKKLNLFFTIFLLIYSSFISYLILALILLRSFDIDDGLLIVGLTLFYLIGNFFLVSPLLVHKRKQISSLEILDNDTLSTRKVYPLVGVMIFTVLTFVSAVYAPTSASLGAAALRALRIGGGIEASLCFKKEKVESLPSELFPSGSEACTVPLLILFNVGDMAYVKEKHNQQRVFGIKRSEIYYEIFPLSQNKETPQSHKGNVKEG